MDVKKVMKALEKLYGKDKLKPFKDKKMWEVYNLAYLKGQEIAKAMTDDDYLIGESDATSNRVLYQTIMRVWEKIIRSGGEYNFPDFPECSVNDDIHVNSGRVDTWAAML